jgi:hypothetical protein
MTRHGQFDRAGTTCEAVLTVSVRQFAQPFLEKPPFRFLLGEAESLFIGGLDFQATRLAGFPRNVMLDMFS